MVAGCGTRSGRRDDRIKTMGRWGGWREKKTWENKFIHPDAESGLDNFFAKCEDLSSNTNMTLSLIDIQEHDDRDENHNDVIWPIEI